MQQMRKKSIKLNSREVHKVSETSSLNYLTVLPCEKASIPLLEYVCPLLTFD